MRSIINNVFSYLFQPSFADNGYLDSGFSLSEKILYASYIADKFGNKRELQPPAVYKEKLLELKNTLKEEIKNGKTPENAIKDYLKATIKNKEQFSGTAAPTETLETGKTNCVSSTAMFLSLSEMLDRDLFEKSCVGDLVFHVFARKKTCDGYENIDYGKVFPDSKYIENYVEPYGIPLENRSKEYIIPLILIKGNERLNSKERLDYLKKTFKNYPQNDADSWLVKGHLFMNSFENYEEAIRCYETALKINPDFEEAQKAKNRLQKHPSHEQCNPTAP